MLEVVVSLRKLLGITKNCELATSRNAEVKHQKTWPQGPKAVPCRVWAQEEGDRRRGPTDFSSRAPHPSPVVQNGGSSHNPCFSSICLFQ